MASASSGGSSRVTLGLILMTIAMLSIPLVDGLAKHLSVTYSPLFLGWARYAVASLIVLPFTAAIHGPRLFPAARQASHVFRTVFLVTAMTLYFLDRAHTARDGSQHLFRRTDHSGCALGNCAQGASDVSESAEPYAGVCRVHRHPATRRFDGSGILLALGSGIFFAFI